VWNYTGLIEREGEKGTASKNDYVGEDGGRPNAWSESIFLTAFVSGETS
jgi:hypothetical protein